MKTFKEFWEQAVQAMEDLNWQEKSDLAQFKQAKQRNEERDPLHKRLAKQEIYEPQDGTNCSGSVTPSSPGV